MADFTIQQFRIDFPEFASDTKYPDTMITFWSGIGDKLLNVTRWDLFQLRTEGLSLFTAHQITLAAMNVDDASADIDPGRSTAVITSENAGGVSVSMDTAASLEEAAGHYNETLYGRQFLRLSRLVGTGGAFV
jgi:hypothetical protein